MAYKIVNPDGTTLVTLADGVVDQSTTSLSLVGKNTSNFGEYWNNNLVRILSNSANVSSAPPRSPLKGQLWYDTTQRRLKVYDAGFKNVSGVPFSPTRPSTTITGDMWFDSTNYQLNIVKGTASYVIGPAYPSTGSDPVWGWIKPPESPSPSALTDSLTADVLVLKTNGTPIAIASNEVIATTATTTLNYLPNVSASTSTSEIVNGITIDKDLRVYGQMTNNYLALALDLDRIGIPGGVVDFNDPIYIDTHNTYIATILDGTFPSNPGEYLNPGTGMKCVYAGLPLGTVARVLCYTNDPIDGYQVRLFKTDINGDSTRWVAWTGIFTTRNVVDL